MSNRTAIFVDGANLYATHKALGFDIDFKLLLKYFKSEYNVTRAYYYTAIRVEDNQSREEGHQSIRPLLDYLEYNGWTMVTKMAKSWYNEDTGRTKVKGDMDAELCVDAMKLGFAGRIERAIFVTGDGDFKPLLHSLQDYGVECIVISTMVTKPPMCADELRRQCDEFKDLNDLPVRKGMDASASVSKRSRYGG